MIGTSPRALARVAARDLARHRGRTVLVALLVLLPVAAMTAGIAILRTVSPTQDRLDQNRFGQGDLQLSNLSHEAALAFLPPGSRIEPFDSANAVLVVPGAKIGVSLRRMDVDGLARGVLALRTGRAPDGPGEVAVSESVAEVAGVRIGGRLELEGRPALTVVGFVENELWIRESVVLVGPNADLGVPESERSWIVQLPPGADEQAIYDAAMNPTSGNPTIPIAGRHLGALSSTANDASPTVLVLGALAMIESALVAAAAFAVSIRRRQRELGLLAAAGATPRQLAATVLAGAGIVGVVAAGAGVCVGIAGAFLASPFLDQLTERRNPPIVVEPVAVVGPFVIGVIAALIAGLVPARTVARMPVLLSLSGRRPPQSPAHRTLALGVGAVGLAVILTAAGAEMSRKGPAEPALLLLVAGAVLGTLGFGACSPWLLERLEVVARRLPLAGRIAFRDSARARSRSSPIVTAVLASFAGAVAIGTWTASRDADNLKGWVPVLFPDQIVVNGPGAATAGSELLQDGHGVVAGLEMAQLGPQSLETFVQYALPGALDKDGKRIQIETGVDGSYLPMVVSEVSVATPELLQMAHAESGAADLAAGRPVLLWHEAITAPTLEIQMQSTTTTSGPAVKREYPLRVIVTGVGGAILPSLLLPAAIADELHLAELPGEAEPYVLRFDHPVTDADLAEVRAVAAHYPYTYADTLSAPTRPGDGFRMAIIAAALLFAVSVTGIAVALGEAESRPEQRSLLALGADPRLRRRIAASRAAVLALLAGVLAVPAGILPVWGLLASRNALLVVPWPEVAAAVVALPLLAVVGTWLLSRPIPDWSAFRGEGRG